MTDAEGALRSTVLDETYRSPSPASTNGSVAAWPNSGFNLALNPRRHDTPSYRDPSQGKSGAATSGPGCAP